MKSLFRQTLSLFILISALAAQPLTENLILDEELSALRAITVTKKATFSDVCKLVLIHRNELEMFTTDEARCARLAELGIYDTAAVGRIHLKPATKGAVAKAVLNLYDLEKTLLFRLTGSEWYAIQNAEVLSLIDKGSNSWDELSGEELVTIMDIAMQRAGEKASWMQPKNPYRDFGYETYPEMDQKTKPLEPEAKGEEKSDGTRPTPAPAEAR
ncbi:MAG TPA: hypothetical protein PKY99_01875 [Turneriella sp.]|nr:hypothetical protein [Turneriella sp.]